ncbi:MAG: polysaccharide pyruvyl transferase family protein [Clostridia bacterium]|nr:polysaccharide pyruvyl transferase family protein [Clostridia bacterium]MBR6523966.1 polysaccharide pyruvyl transferase family protein [Clostridia bacterium]
MKKFLIYQHGGSLNRGCEALARTVSKEIHKIFAEADIVISSNSPQEDIEIENVKIIKANGLKRKSAKYVFYHIDKRLFNIKWLENMILSDKVSVKLGKSQDCCIAIGGDNYCYSKGKMLWPTDRILKKKGCKTMLWGASIEPKELPGELSKHLKTFDIITARESITYNALVENGLSDKVHLVSDPAFLLETEFLDLPMNWKEGNMVGINLSPLAFRYSQDSDAVSAAAYKLVDYILDNTEMNIALIPHVRKKGNDDIAALLPIFERYKSTNRVVLMDDISLNCKQLKGYIARCRFFVGARTHSTIAAYSSGVPTVVLGYSVKARGIAKDLFGTEENFVVPVQTIDNPQRVIDSFMYVLDNEESIKKLYTEKLPEYIKKAKNSAKFLKNLIGD